MGSGGRSIDFICQDNICKYGALNKVEGLSGWRVDMGPDNICRQHIARHLHALKLPGKQVREQFGGHGFAGPRRPFNQDVTPRQIGDETVANELAVAQNEGAINTGENLVVEFLTVCHPLPFLPRFLSCSR